MEQDLSNKNFYNNKGHYKWNTESLKQDRVKKLFKIALEIINKRENLTILDIGTGTGDFIFKLSEISPLNNYYGNDISSNVIELNKKIKPFIKWSVNNFNFKTNFQDNYFDIVIAGEVIEHLSETDNFFSEMMRIIKPDGHLIITTPNLASWLDRITLLFGMQPFSTEVSNHSRIFGREAFYKFIKSNESSSAGHLRCFTKKALISVLRFYKFNLIKEVPCHIHNIFINKFVDKILPQMSQNTLIVVKK